MAELYPAGWGQGRLANALKSFAKTSEWMHIVSGVGALCAFLTDIVRPKFPHCTLWALLALLLTAGVVWALGKAGRIARQTGEHIISFMAIPAFVLLALLAAQTFFGNTDDSVIAQVVPGVADLQQKLGITNSKIDEAKKAVEKLSAQQQELVKEFHVSMGMPEQALAKVLERIDKLAPLDDKGTVRGMLQSIAEQYNKLEYEMSKDTTGEPQARALLTQAEADFAQGNFDQARLEMRHAAEIDRTNAIDFASRATASTNAAANALEHSAKLAEMTGRYSDAAEDFSDGAKLIAATDAHRAWQLTHGQEQDLYKQGLEHRDATAARQAVDICKNLVAVASKSHWDSDLQAGKSDLDLAIASLSNILGKPVTEAPSVRRHERLHRPLSGRGYPPQTPLAEAQPPSENAAQPTPQPQSEGLFGRLTNWAIRNSSRGSPQQTRQVTPEPTGGPSSFQRQRFAPPVAEAGPRRRHENVVTKNHNSSR